MFYHSVKVPRLYKDSAKILQAVIEQKDSVRNLLYKKKRYDNINAIYALVCESLRRAAQLDSLLNSTKLLIKEPRLDPWLARVLITELLWCKQRLSSESKPIQTILSYKDLLSMNLETVPRLEKPTEKVQIPRYVRINRLLMSPVEAIDGFRNEGWTLVRSSRNDYSNYLSTVKSLTGDQFTVDIHFPDVLVFPAKTHFFDYSCYKDGSIILQNKASYIPVFLLNPTPGSVVMDMCAAPGLKTSHMAQLMNNEGTIYAVEKDLERYESLQKHLDSVWATCVKTINRDTTTLTSRDCPDVEYILVDPSCSGSGMMNRISVGESDNQVDSERLEKLSGFQITILRHALLNFPDVKRVVYSTCSVYPEENEHVIQEIIKGKGCDGFKLVSPAEMLKGKWFNYGNEVDYPGIGGKCLYARPESDYTNGFFVAVFERKSEEEISQDRLNNAKFSRRVKTEEQPSPADNYEDFTDTNVNVKREKAKLSSENSTQAVDNEYFVKKQLKVGNTKFEKCDYNIKSEKYQKVLTAQSTNVKSEFTTEDGSDDRLSQNADSKHRTKKQNKSETIEESIKTSKKIKKEMLDQNECTVKTEIDPSRKKGKKLIEDSTEHTENSGHVDRSEKVKQKKVKHSKVAKEEDSIASKAIKNEDDSKENIPIIKDISMTDIDISIKKEKRKKLKREVTTDCEEKTDFLDGENELKKKRKNNESFVHNIGDDILVKSKKIKKNDSDEEGQIKEFIADPVLEDSSSDKRKNKKKKYELATTFDQNENVNSEIVNNDNITKKKKKRKREHEEPEIEHVEVESNVKSERKHKKKHKQDHEPEIEHVEVEAHVKSERKHKEKHKQDHEPEIEHVEIESNVKSERKHKKKHKQDHEVPEIEHVEVESNVKSERKHKKKHKKDHKEPEIEHVEVEDDVKSERKHKKKHKKDHEEPEIEHVEVEAHVKSERKHKKKHKQDHEEPEIEHVEVESNVKSERKHKKKHKQDHEEPEIEHVEVESNVKSERKHKKKHKQDHEPEIEHVEVEAHVKSERKHKKKYKQDHEEPEIEHVEVESNVKSERKHKKKQKEGLEVPEIGNGVEVDKKNE